MIVLSSSWSSSSSSSNKVVRLPISNLSRLCLRHHRHPIKYGLRHQTLWYVEEIRFASLVITEFDQINDDGDNTADECRMYRIIILRKS
mmetsp:Transcript_29859/g.30169  ORF Transcript_29859/g.30169 Transcript_29859/m.30169 type:complete len:89 (+) Transcript_29859:703-969(+)